jgi:transposase
MTLTLPDARGLSDEVLEALRVRAIHGCELGFTQADVAALLGVSQETVSRWWTAYAAGGPDALPGGRTGRPVGSGRTLSDDRARRIRLLIDGHSPEDLGVASPLWSRRAVRDLIREEFGIDMPVRTVGEYLKRWGYTAKSPRRRARRQDPEGLRRWREEDYPAIAARARREGAEIHWCDETGAAADEHPRRGYARRGEPAMMEVPGPHIRINQISAISAEGAVRFLIYEGAMNGDRFVAFLERMIRCSTRKIFLIADRLKAHDNPTVRGWLEAHEDRIELFFLPPYAPESNPDEYLNNDLKGNVHDAGLPDDKDELRSRVQRFMLRLAAAPERVRSYFQHPDVRYAAM